LTVNLFLQRIALILETLKPNIKYADLLQTKQNEPSSLYTEVFRQLVNYYALSTTSIPAWDITHFTLLNLEAKALEALAAAKVGNDVDKRRALVKEMTEFKGKISAKLNKSVSRIREALFKRNVRQSSQQPQFLQPLV
jgi:hypothetical protein